MHATQRVADNQPAWAFGNNTVGVAAEPFDLIVSDYHSVLRRSLPQPPTGYGGQRQSDQREPDTVARTGRGKRERHALCACVDHASDVVAVDAQRGTLAVALRGTPSFVESLGEHEQLPSRCSRLDDDPAGPIVENARLSGRARQSVNRPIHESHAGDIDPSDVLADKFADARV